MAAAAPPKMPAKFVLEQTVMPAYEAVLGDFGRFFGRAGLPLVGLVGAALLVVLVQPYARDRSTTLTIAAWVVEFVVVSAFALSWHRVLFGRTASAGTGAVSSAWGGLRFLGYCFLMLLFVRAMLNGFAWLFVLGGAFVVITGSIAVLRGLPQTLAKALGRPLGALLSIFIIIVLVAHVHAGVPIALVQFLDQGLYVVALMPIARLLLALPAVATGARGDVVRAVWRLSGGRSAVLYHGLLLCFLPFSGAVWFIETMFGPQVWHIVVSDDAHPIVPPPFGGPEFIASSAEAVFILLGTAVIIGYLTLAYRQLGEAASPVAGNPIAGNISEGPSRRDVAIRIAAVIAFCLLIMVISSLRVEPVKPDARLLTFSERNDPTRVKSATTSVLESTDRKQIRQAMLDAASRLENSPCDKSLREPLRNAISAYIDAQRQSDPGTSDEEQKIIRDATDYRGRFVCRTGID
jgi:hypothetical protein